MEKKTVLRKICGVVAALMVLAMTLTVLPAASKAETVTVTFNPNGGTNTDPDLHDDQWEYDTETFGDNMPSNPEREKYVFTGWYSAAEGGSKITSSTRVADHTTVYAHWSPKASSITLSDPSWNGTPGAEKELTATVTMEDPEVTPPDIVWSSNNTEVATVAATAADKATVTAVSPGEATITAKCGGQSVACVVTVAVSDPTPTTDPDPTPTTDPDPTPTKAPDPTPTKAPDPTPTPTAKPTPTPVSLLSFELDPAKKTLYDSQTVQLQPTKIKPSDAKIVSIAYASDKPSVASVDSNGKVTAKGYGEATITAIATDAAGNNVSATSKITVKPMIYLSFDPNSSKIGYQDVVEMTIKITNPSENYAWVKRSNQRIYYTGYTEKVKAKDGTVWYKCKLTDGKATLKIKPQYNGKVKVTVSHHDATSVSADFTVSGYHNLPTTGQNDTLIYILAGAGAAVAAGLAAAYFVKRKKEHAG